MPNVAKVLKEEIARISKKQAKAAVAPIRKPSVRVRRDVADLKRRMASMERETRLLHAKMKRMEATLPATAVPEAGRKARITAKGMRSLRRKLGLTGQEFAKLLGLTSQNVYQWEQKEGPLRVRQSTRAAILSIRGLGAREARQRLAEMKAKATKRTTKRGRRKSG